jgi:hypothetical protein
MPYGAVLYIYADCMSNPLFKILMLALVSLSCFVWHPGHSHLRMARFLTRGFLYPQIVYYLIQVVFKEKEMPLYPHC